MSGGVVGLLAILLFCHFLGDFTPLSTARMQEAKSTGKPVGPIAAHALVHGVLVAAAVLLAAAPGMPTVLLAGGLEFGTHFAIDWARGLLGGRYPRVSDPNHQLFWSALGVDQFAHGLVLVWIAWLVL